VTIQDMQDIALLCCVHRNCQEHLLDLMQGGFSGGG
jgi:hypothetical protein